MNTLKTLVLAALMLAPAALTAQDILGAFLADTSGTPTNVRRQPRGKVAITLPDTTSYMLTVGSPRDGWWQLLYLEDAERATEVSLPHSSTGLWIHHSVLGVGTRNYGGERLHLRAAPGAAAKSIYSFTQELTLHPLEVRRGWVRVVTTDGLHTGWIEEEMLCDNPLTNCC